MNKQLLRTCEKILAFSGALSFLISWVLNAWMERAMPTQPEGGFVFPMIIHGSTIYANRVFHYLFYVLFYGGFALFLGAVLIDFYKDPFERRKQLK